jgi:hypothetical protein
MNDDDYTVGNPKWEKKEKEQERNLKGKEDLGLAVICVLVFVILYAASNLHKLI